MRNDGGSRLLRYVGTYLQSISSTTLIHLFIHLPFIHAFVTPCFIHSLADPGGQ